MRTIYDPLTGADNTATAKSFLQSGQTLVSSYLYSWKFVPPWLSNNSGSTQAYYAILIKTLQLAASGVATVTPTAGLTFIPSFPIGFDKLEYGIGFEDHPVSMTLDLDDSKTYSAIVNTTGGASTAPQSAFTPANLNLKQAFLLDVFRECPFWIHQAIFTDFPSKGGTFLGTALMFRGFIRKVDASGSSLILTISSLMDVFQQVQIPTQTLTPNNRALPYILGQILVGSDSFGFSTFNVISPTVFQMSGGGPFTYNQLRDCWITTVGSWDAFEFVAPPARNGNPPTPTWRIIGNDASVAGLTTIYFEKAPIVCVSNAFLTLYSQNPLSGGSPGFPFVPPQEFSA